MSNAPERSIPRSDEAEAGVLGSILCLPNETLDSWQDKIPDAYFFAPTNLAIYQALLAMREKKIGIDLITLTQFLRDNGTLETVGGAPYVTSLFTGVPSAANVEYYIAILRQKFIRRQMIVVGTEMIRRAYDDAVEESEILEQAQVEVTSLSEETHGRQTVQPIREDIQEALEYAEKIYARRGDAATHGLATGFYDLDRMTGGFVGGQLIVLAGRPAMGKTAIGMNIVEYVALTEQKPVLVFSLEMSRGQLARRLLMSRAGISMERLRNGFFSKEELPKLLEAGTELIPAPVYLDATPALRVVDFKARSRRMKSQAGIELIVVDYLQLMKSPSRRTSDNRVLEITEITGALKEIAKELDVVVLAMAQLNRNVENRSGMAEPRLSDLRESGSIENDADLVGLLYRREYYSHDAEDKGRAKLIIAKHRDGPPGEVELFFADDLMRFRNVTDKQWSNKPEERQSQSKHD